MQGEGKKLAILRRLKDKYPEFISGEELSRDFNISRTAVWKYVNSLKEDGYVFESSSRVGYRLVLEPGIINSYELSDNLGTRIVGKKILYFDSIDSTNNYAKKIAMEDAEEGLTVVAGSQSGGRGRIGRSWDSPPDTGVYMSVILKPLLPPGEIQVVTLAAAVAVAKVIEEITGMKPGIKWPNDVLLDGRKVCGILTEMNSEIERVNFVVLGIGINYTRKQGEFPHELRDKAISLAAFAGNHGIDMGKWCKLAVIRAVIQEMDKLYKMILLKRYKEITDMWKEYSVTLGSEIRIISGVAEYTGTAEDITEDGSLVVASSDGSIRTVQSGEIFIRGVNGYI